MKEKSISIKMIFESTQSGFNQTVESFFTCMVLFFLRWFLTGLICNLYGVMFMLLMSFLFDILAELAKRWADDMFSKSFAIIIANVWKLFFYLAVIYLL